VNSLINRWFVKDKNFYKQMLILAIPVVLQSVINISVNIMDTVMLGSYGEIQISASSLANDFLHIFMFLNLGVGGGSAVLTAQYWGRKDIQSVKCVVALMLRIVLSLALAFFIATVLFARQIMGIYTTDPEVIEKGVVYLRIMLPTFFLTSISTSLTGVLRTARQVKVPLIMVIVSFFVNIFFNWVFIFGNLGAPEMQIAGAALGTVIARVVETAIIIVYVFRIDKQIAFRFKDMFLRVRAYIKPFIKYCLPVVGSDTLFGFGNTVITIIVGHTTTEFVAANAIVSTLVRLTTVFANGVSNAGGIMTGNTLGAGEIEKGYRGAVTFTVLTVLLGIVGGCTVLFLCPWIISLYNITAETSRIAHELINAVALTTVFMAIENAMTKGILRSGGDTRFLLVADVLFLWVVSIPLGALVALVWHGSPFLIYTSLRVDWLIKSVWCLFRLKSRKWIHVVETPKVKRVEEQNA